MATVEEVFYNLLTRSNCRCTICGGREETPDEVLDMAYKPIGSENRVPVFDINNSRYYYYHNPTSMPFRMLRKNYERHDNQNVASSNTAILELHTIYRRNPIDWSRLRFLELPVPKKPNTLQTSYVEHNNPAMATEDDFVDSGRYGRLLTKNIKFSFLMRNFELQSSIYGFFRNPFVRELGRDWAENWRFLNESNENLPDYVRLMNIHTNKEVLAFFSFFKNSISRYANRLKLDDSRFWLDQAREPGVYCEHLLNWVKMMTCAFNLAYCGMSKIWNHHVRTQMDLAHLIEQTLKK